MNSQPKAEASRPRRLSIDELKLKTSLPPYEYLPITGSSGSRRREMTWRGVALGTDCSRHPSPPCSGPYSGHGPEGRQSWFRRVGGASRLPGVLKSKNANFSRGNRFWATLRSIRPLARDGAGKGQQRTRGGMSRRTAAMATTRMLTGKSCEKNDWDDPFLERYVPVS